MYLMAKLTSDVDERLKRLISCTVACRGDNWIGNVQRMALGLERTMTRVRVDTSFSGCHALPMLLTSSP